MIARFSLMLGLAGAVLGVQPGRAAANAQEAHQTQAIAAPLRTFQHEHRGHFGGSDIRFTSVVEEYLVPDADSPGASVVVTSYVARVKPGNIPRPVIFAFNGGPGSASIWLHLGYLGPQRIDFDDVDKPRTIPPFRLIPNEDSPLDVADIVLIDPPGTGYSRVLPGGKTEQFYGVKQDASAMANVIQQWIGRHNRTNSPKYLLSESYGTIRAAVMSEVLAGGPTSSGSMDGITLNGVILLGQAMDATRIGASDDRAIIEVLPSLAATACYFRKVQQGCTPEGQVAAARLFIQNDYLAALHAGSALPVDERKRISTKLSAIIGIPAAAIEAYDLRISAQAFARQLLATERRRLGMYDARFTSPLAGGGGDPVADDAAMGQYTPGFVAAWNDYARSELGVTIKTQYEAIAFKSVNARWDFGFGPGVPVGRNYAANLAVAMNRNPGLRAMIGTGYFDLVTPLESADYTVRHAGMPLDRVSFRAYPAGHMPYLGKDARESLARDIRAFVTTR